MKDDEKELLLEARRAAEAVSLKGLKKDDVKLSPEEEAFCVEFVASMDRKRAIKAAGYKGNNWAVMASRWLAKKKIQEKIEHLRLKTEVRSQLTRETYLQMLETIYERAMADGDYTGANRASELLGKTMGYLTEQKAVLNVTAKLPEDKTQKMAEIQRLARIAGVKLDG